MQIPEGGLLTRIAARRTRIVGTTVGTAESSFLKSRGWIPYRAHSSSFLNCPAVCATLPVRTKRIGQGRDAA